MILSNSRGVVDAPPTDGAINLMEAVTVGELPASHALTDTGWFHASRFGMFVHYGLYSLEGLGEWRMFREKIPAAQYNRLADRFTAADFDADELVGLAKRAGAGYVVFGARHHEGFCLWDTRTTPFNSVKTASGRDLVREYVEACRRAGLRTGIYYSVMSWQWPAIHTGPARDPKGWKAMVAETHEQLRELMTDYGQIDYLWYDGCVVPGLGDATIRAKHWRSRELNAMVRRLQPGIMINDRAALPEDVTTPEQHLTPAPRGRAWECCQTMGNHWGWHREEVTPKPARTLIQEIVFCARYGGNYLLNVGPEPCGRVPAVQAERMEEIGRWMAVNGESIRGSRRTAYTESQHMIGSATCRDNTLYFHISKWPDGPVVIAGVTVPIVSVRLLGFDDELTFEQAEDGCVTINGLPLSAPISHVAVLAMTLAAAPSEKTPPSLLVEHDTGRIAPPEAVVQTVEGWQMGRRQKLEFNVPANGVYHMELCVTSAKAQRIAAILDHLPLADSLRVECGNYPSTLRLPDLSLKQGQMLLELDAQDADFGLCLWRLQPVWRALTPKYWRTVGPFPTGYGPQGETSQVRAAMQAVFPPELEEKEGQVAWKANSAVGEVVNLGLLCGGDDTGVCYARMTIISPEPRDLSVLLGCDWWANIFVNGQLLRSERPPGNFAQDGAWFNGWKPSPASIRLRTGENVILVKCHPGSIDNWFTFYLNDPHDLQFVS